MCRSQSCVPTMTVLPSPSLVPAASSSAPRRGSGPEIFTFDPLPERVAVPTKRPSISRAHRKRTRRVLYPQLKVRRQLPAEEPNPAKRLLFLLLAVVFCQILMAEEGVPVTVAAEEAPSTASSAPTAATPLLEPLNLTSESPDYSLDLSSLLQQHPAAF